MKFRVSRTSGRGGNDLPCDEAVYEHTGVGKDSYDWFVEFNGLDGLTAFCEKYGSVIMESPAAFAHCNGLDAWEFWSLEIYDYYRD